PLRLPQRLRFLRCLPPGRRPPRRGPALFTLRHALQRPAGGPQRPHVRRFLSPPRPPPAAPRRVWLESRRAPRRTLGSSFVTDGKNVAAVDRGDGNGSAPPSGPPEAPLKAPDKLPEAPLKAPDKLPEAPLKAPDKLRAG